MAAKLPQGSGRAPGGLELSSTVTQRSRSSSAVVPVSAQTHALFLDFDGTLAPLQDDADSVVLPTDGDKTLLALKQIFDDAIVLISGRDIRDLSARTPIDLWRAGGHGLDVCRPGQTPPINQVRIDGSVRKQVDTIVAGLTGVRVEDKGPVLAIHYRQNPSAEYVLLEAIRGLAETLPDYKAQNGKCVIELKPITANKGRALQTLMQAPPFLGRIPVMVGDDTTDEDAMAAAIQLGGVGVKVGAGDSCAQYRMIDPDSVWVWLRGILNEHA